MRTLVAAVVVAWLVSSPAAFDHPKPAQGEKAPAQTFKVGDPAPALVVTRWLSGDAVPRFEPGKVYVVEFWATWCAPCIRHMPHLVALQGRYKDQGVTVIGFTSSDIRGAPGNSEEKVAAFVKQRGPLLKYTFAFADNHTTTDAWLKGAGQEGFCTFVVDRAGRIAYMGGSQFLDMALPKILAGDQSAKAIGAEMAQVDADYRAVCALLDRDSNPDAFLRSLVEFEAKYPQLADSMPACGVKLGLLLKRGNTDEAKAYAKTLVAKANEQDNAIVFEFAHAQLQDQTESKELMALALQAAEALVRMDGGTNAWSLLRLADTHRVSGNMAKAKEYARRALEAGAAESPSIRQEIEKEASKLGAHN